MSQTNLAAAQIRSFIEDGFVRIDRAFSRDTAETARRMLWRDTGCDPDDPHTWTKPVVRLGEMPGRHFRTPPIRRRFMMRSTGWSEKAAGCRA
jgi:hypothetical protein